MTDQSLNNSLHKGMLLIDVILGIALATTFMAVIGDMSLGARSIFRFAKDKDAKITIFEQNPFLSTTTVQLYGNEEIEEQDVLFTRLQLPSSIETNKISSSPLCSVDFFDPSPLGSYPISHKLDINIFPIPLPIDPSLPLTDLIVRNNIAYVSTDSNKSSDPDILIFDIRDNSNAKMLSSLNTGPGIRAITLSSNRIFAAAASTASQLHIIRMDSLSSLILENKYSLPLPYATATPVMASTILLNNKKIYLGTEKWDGNELTIIDVADPLNPVLQGGFDTDSKINDILVKDDTAFVANSNINQLYELNISNPKSIFIEGSFSPSGWSRQEGKTISLFENLIDFGRTSGGFDISTDHELFSFASTSSNNSLNIPGGVYGIIRDRHHVYIATRQIDKEFEIFDQSLSTSSALTFPLPVAPQKMTCDGRDIYILAGTAPIIYKVSFD